MLTLLFSTERIYERGSNAFFLKTSAESSFPFAVDDPQKNTKGADVNELIVDIFSGKKICTLNKDVKPKSGALVATNFAISTEERSVL